MDDGQRPKMNVYPSFFFFGRMIGETGEKRKMRKEGEGELRVRWDGGGGGVNSSLLFPNSGNIMIVIVIGTNCTVTWNQKTKCKVFSRTAWCCVTKLLQKKPLNCTQCFAISNSSKSWTIYSWKSERSWPKLHFGDQWI